jgi:hypothetical protein
MSVRFIGEITGSGPSSVPTTHRPTAVIVTDSTHSERVPRKSPPLSEDGRNALEMMTPANAVDAATVMPGNGACVYVR